jgi:sterol 3beta-glucosyltransferase
MTMASSIHTIYRPVARSRRGEPSSVLFPVDGTLVNNADSSTGHEQSQRSTMSDEDTDADDFELPKSAASSRRVSDRRDKSIGLSPVFEHTFPKVDLRHHAERSGSMSTVQTVKPNRRARLAEKLGEVFDLIGINEVIAGGYYIYSFDTMSLTTYSLEMPCWLMRSVCACACNQDHITLDSICLSAPGLHVLDQFVPLLLCPHAIQRGEII